jgi:cytochrome c biogenesis protein CcdA
VADPGTLALSYAAGALSTLSPCVLPILPILLFGMMQQHAWGPVALAGGLSLSFATIGILVATLGFSIGIDPSVLRIGVAVLLLAMGIILLVPALQGRLAMAAGPMAGMGQASLDRLRVGGLGGQFLLGAGLGAIWSPCTGPTLGAAIGLAAQGESLAKAATVMAIFGLGAATPILVLAYGSRQALAVRRQRLMQLSQVAKPAMGAVLVAVGLFVITGFDKIAETYLTQAMPEWLLNLTTRL